MRRAALALALAAAAAALAAAPALADTVVCHVTESAAGVRVDVASTGFKASLVQPADACVLTVSGQTVYVNCLNAPKYYPFSVVVEGAAVSGAQSSGADCIVEPAAGAPSLEELGRLAGSAVVNTTNVTAWWEAVERRLPGGWGSIALLVDTAVFISTRSPAMTAAATLLLSPLLPRWLTAPAVAVSAAWLLYEAWRRLGT